MQGDLEKGFEIGKRIPKKYSFRVNFMGFLVDDLYLILVPHRRKRLSDVFFRFQTILCDDSLRFCGKPNNIPFPPGRVRVLSVRASGTQCRTECKVTSEGGFKIRILPVL